MTADLRHFDSEAKSVIICCAYPEISASDVSSGGVLCRDACASVVLMSMSRLRMKRNRVFVDNVMSSSNHLKRIIIIITKEKRNESDMAAVVVGRRHYLKAGEFEAG